MTPRHRINLLDRTYRHDRRSRILICLLLIALLVLLPACGSDSGPDETGNTTTGTSAGTAGPVITSVPTDPGEPTVYRTERISLPNSFEERGWQLIRILADGRWVVNSGGRLSILNVLSGEEIIIREAEFGIQAAANDRYVAYGVGGDEFLTISVYHIDSGYEEQVLSDTHGFLDLELTRADGLLVSRIRYTGVEAVLDAWIRYDIRTRATTVIPSGERSYAKYLFREHYPDKNAEWTYDVGQTWHNAWLNDSEQLFYSEETRLGRDDYEFRIYQSDRTGHDILLYEQSGGPVPEVRWSGVLLIMNGTQAIRTDTGERLSIPDDLSETDFPHGASLIALRNDQLYIAADNQYGLPSVLFRLYPD